MAIIGISGKMQSGKSTVAKIIQYLISESKVLNKDQFSLSFKDYLQSEQFNNVSFWEIHSFADALKDIVCILTGCTREQLEDINFKNSILNSNWQTEHPNVWNHTIVSMSPTYRQFMQVLGTDLLRNKLHENVWINALFSKYKQEKEYKYEVKPTGNIGFGNKVELKVLSDPKSYIKEYPNWVIPDVRFLNEIEAIKNRGGIIIRCNRDLDYANYISKYNDTSIITYDDLDSNQNMLSLAHFRREDRPTSFKDKWYSNKFEHVSETELDTYAFDYTIDNNGTMEELIEQVKEILINENLL